MHKLRLFSVVTFYYGTSYVAEKLLIDVFFREKAGSRIIVEKKVLKEDLTV